MRAHSANDEGKRWSDSRNATVVPFAPQRPESRSWSIRAIARTAQRRTGAVAGNGAIYDKAQVRIEGASRIFEREAQAGRRIRFHFCPNCGTSLYWEGDIRPDWYVVAVGAFADPNFPPPSVSIFEESMHPWVLLPDNIKHARRSFLAS
jgi:hypothetical protein